MLRILIGDANEDTFDVFNAPKQPRPLPWVVPKAARIGDAAVFHLPHFGFVARGVVGSLPEASLNKKGRYISNIRDIALLPTPVPLAFVRDNFTEWKWPTYPKTYTSIEGDFEIRLIGLIDGYQESITPPLVEGKATSVTATVYERSAIARQECIDHYGPQCFACGFSFGETYGELAEGFIHVHHLKPLASRNGEYRVNPVKDLRPICPNCHVVLHLRNPPLSITELRKILKATAVQS